MAPETRHMARQRGASEGEPSNAPTNQPEVQIPSITSMGEPVALQNEDPNSNEQLRERVRQLESALDNALALNRRASVAMGSASRREDADLANRRSPDEVDQPANPPMTSSFTALLERPLATAPTSVDLSNTPQVDNMFSNVSGFMSQASPLIISSSEPSWTQHYPIIPPSRTEISPLPQSSWFPQPPHYPPPYPYPWYSPAIPQSSVSMAFPPPITTAVPASTATPLMSMFQPTIPATVAPLPVNYPPQVYPATVPVAPVAPVVPIQDSRFDELKAAMDAQAALIAALIAQKDKEPSKVVKRLRPLADEVYTEILPEKYKRPTFTKFDGDGNPGDHVTIFEIECGTIVANEKLKLQQFPASLSGNALRWFNNRPSGSINSWDEFVEQFTEHFQSMEIPVTIEHLRQCQRESGERFATYVKRFRSLTSQMKETPDIKELVKICAMNAGSAAWFLSGAQCNTFEQLFERMLIFEELGRVSASLKNAKASTNAVTELGESSREKQLEGPRNNNEDRKVVPQQRREWRNMEDYTFNTRDTERWFDVLKSKGKITPWIPKNPPKPEDEKKENFCRFHQMLGHPTVICRDVMEKIQELLDKGDIKYKAANANVMTVSHLSLPMKSHKGKEKQGEEMDVPMANVEDTKVSPASTIEDKGCSTPLSIQKFEVQANQGKRLFEKDELDKEKMEDQLAVRTTSTQKEVKSKISKTRLRLMCSFGGKIVIQGRKQHYFGGDTRLVVLEHDCSYSSLVAQIRGTCSTSIPLVIKCQLPGESFNYLITIANDEDLVNVIKEQEEFNTSHESTSRLHFFVSPKMSRSQSNQTWDKKLGASIKITAARRFKREAANNSTNSRRHHKRSRSPPYYGQKKFDALRKNPQKEIWIWRPRVSSERVTPQDQNDGQWPHYNPRGVTLG